MYKYNNSLPGVECSEIHFSLSSTIVGISISRHIATTPTVTDGAAIAVTIISLLVPDSLLVVVGKGCVADDLVICEDCVADLYNKTILSYHCYNVSH